LNWIEVVNEFLYRILKIIKFHIVTKLKNAIYTLALSAISSLSFGQSSATIEKLNVQFMNDSSVMNYIRDNRIYHEGWVDLPQVGFWQKVVTLSPDSGYLNIGSTRTIIGKFSVKEWNLIPEVQKNALKAKVREEYKLSESDNIYFTTGKSHFYDFENAMKVIGKAYKIFEKEGVSPFYAQSILLIECPGKLQKSTAGANGHFQLMPGVAMNMGLKVNKNVDERRDFEKCAWAAARFIQKICIPNANKLLEERGIDYSSDELWYRLLVLHIYHAGSGNVAKAIDAFAVKPVKGSMDIITTLWKTKAGAFGNASQNYSQIALANTVLLYELLHKNCAQLVSNPLTLGSL
jgi:hypothetical protein